MLTGLIEFEQQLAPGGVYIAMNGELFDWDNVRKNYEEGCFESLSDD